MRVVLDTNVLVSGVLSARGICAQILDLVVEGVLLPCVDGRILGEYEDVLHRRELALPRQEVEEILEFLRRFAEPVAAVPLPSDVPDPEDLPFLEVAASADAVLVSGNLRHFPVKSRGGVRVVSPRGLLDLLREQE